MNLPVRWALGVPLATICFVASCLLEGGHPEMLLQATSLAVVGGTAALGMWLLRGPAAIAALLRTAWSGAPADAAAREARIRDLGVLERLAMLGAGLGLAWGLVRAVASFRTPEQVGPALALAMVSVALALLAKVFLFLPLKQHLLQEPAAPSPWPRRVAAVRVLQAVGVAALIAAGGSWVVTGRDAGAFCGTAIVPTALLVLAAALPSLLAAPSGFAFGPVSRLRCQWLADALWSAGSLGVTLGVMHVFSVLDQPRLLAPGVAVAFASFVLPAALALLLQIRGSVAPDVGTDGVERAGSPYPAFAALTVMALCGMVVLVLWILANEAPLASGH
jgi:hypothetical protein